MEKEKKKANHHKSLKTAFDSASLLFTLFAVVLISIVIYLNLQNESAIGVSQPGRHGQGGVIILKISELFVVALGIFFAAFPIIDLIRYLKSRSKSYRQTVLDKKDELKN